MLLISKCPKIEERVKDYLAHLMNGPVGKIIILKIEVNSKV
jgi:hypothetical protein